MGKEINWKKFLIIFIIISILIGSLLAVILVFRPRPQLELVNHSLKNNARDRYIVEIKNSGDADAIINQIYMEDENNSRIDAEVIYYGIEVVVLPNNLKMNETIQFEIDFNVNFIPGKEYSIFLEYNRGMILECNFLYAVFISTFGAVSYGKVPATTDQYEISLQNLGPDNAVIILADIELIDENSTISNPISVYIGIEEQDMNPNHYFVINKRVIVSLKLTFPSEFISGKDYILKLYYNTLYSFDITFTY